MAQKFALEEETKRKVAVLTPQFKTRGISMGRPLVDTQGQYTDEVFVDEYGALHWPVLFLYPQYNQSDYIRDFHEQHTFKDHLAVMFEEIPIWDGEAVYTLSNLEIYTEVGVVQPLDPTPTKQNIKKRWIKVRQTTSLQTVLSHPDYVVPHFPVFYVISSASVFKNTFLTQEL